MLVVRNKKKSFPPFDPEGSGYDYETAAKYKIEPDETGHYQSRIPETGQILKGRKHPTFNKTVQGEAAAGYEIYKGTDGKYYSKKKITKVKKKGSGS